MYQADKINTKEWKLYSKARLPMKYIDYSLDDFRILGKDKKTKDHNSESFEEYMEYYNNLEENLKQGKGLMLCGPVGVAKTWLMTLLSKKVIEIFNNENGKMSEEQLLVKDQSKKYRNRLIYIQGTTMNDLVFRTGLNESEINLRGGIKTIAGLWIDDISKMGETKNKHELIFLDDILRWRDLNALTTFYTSQLPFESKGEIMGLDKVLSKPVHDIIRGNCKIITFKGESQR